MSARSTAMHVVTKLGIAMGSLCLVSVLLAAMPGHRGAAAQSQTEQSSQASENISVEANTTPESVNEALAVREMTPGHGDAHSSHMTMTAMRPVAPGDEQRAKEIVAALRTSLEKYKDYHVALNDGFRIFLPNIPQPEYHFTSYKNGFLESLSFDASRPTSLLYKKTATGYELTGAMYTMPKRATEEQLNERVPLSIAMWHLHTNLCMPQVGQYRAADWTKFGLKGSIATADACSAAGGKFQPSIFGWMVHVYPYEDSMDKIFAMHHHMD